MGNVATGICKMQKRNRIYVSLDERYSALFERWALDERRKLATMATYIVELAIDKAIEDGIIADETERNEENPAGVEALRSVIRKVVSGDPLSGTEVAIAADEAGVSAQELLRRLNKAREGNGETESVS